MNSRFFESPPPRVFAHRGNSAFWPENTLGAFRSARAFTAYVELDVWLSRDGVVMVHHDESLLRTCGVDRPVYDCDCADIQRLDAGAWFWTSHPSAAERVDGDIRRAVGRDYVPTLAEVLRCIPDGFITVEIKHDHPRIGPALKAVVEAEGAADRVLFAGEPDVLMRHAWCDLPDYPSSLSHSEIRSFVDWVRLGCVGAISLRGQAMQVPLVHEGFTLASPEVIAAAHRLGREIQFWTVNDPAVMMSLFEMGADVIMTDDPETGRRIVDSFPQRGRSVV